MEYVNPNPKSYHARTHLSSKEPYPKAWNPDDSNNNQHKRIETCITLKALNTFRTTKAKYKLKRPTTP